MKTPAFRTLNIRTRLLLLCLAVATPLVAMCGLIIWKEYQGLTQTAHRATTFHDAIALRTVSQWIDTQENELQALALTPEVQQNNVALTKVLLTTQAKLEPEWNSLALLDVSGKPIAASSSADASCARNLQATSFWKALTTLKSTQVSGNIRCPITGKMAVLIGLPVQSKGKINSYLVASIKPEAILNLFVGLGETQGSVICVVDKEKRVIARTLDHEKWVGADFTHAKTVTAASKQTRGTIEVVGIADPTPRTYAFDRVPESGWIVIVGIPTAAIYGSAHDRLFIMILCAVLAFGSSVVLAYAFTGNFTGPINELVREAVSIGRGDYSKRVSMNQGGEMGLLARAFNQMAVNLELHREHRLMVEKISESIRQSLDLDQILNTAVLELGRALSASRCCLALVGDAHADTLVGKQLEFNYVWWDPELTGTPLKNRSIMITEGSILRIILEQGAILSLDMMDDSTFSPLFEAAEESPEDWSSIKSLIACPIVLNEQPIGMILVHQCDDRRAWIDLELELVEAVARHVALAMDHAGLFAKTKTLAEQEFLINHIVRAVRTSLDPDTILSTVTEELGKALGVDRCQIAQPRPEGPLVVTHEFHAAGFESKRGVSLYGSKIDFEPTAESATERRSVLGIDLKALEEKSNDAISLQEAPIAIISDASNDKRTRLFREFVDSVESKSLIAAPLLRDDRVLGLLIAHQCAGMREWQSGEVRLMAAVADQLAVAISHAQLFAQVKHQAITDGLTGLYNHIYFKNRLAEELNRAQRKFTNCSLLMIDLDKLKQINDTFGHPVGDAAIRQVAIVLKSLLRSGDTAARYGGEEFAVILPETPLSEAVLIADRLRRHINRNPVPGLGHISGSIGCAAFPSQASGVADLVDKADRALYVAKRNGRNRVCIWDDPHPLQAPMDDSPVLTRVEEEAASIIDVKL
jgi:diguanylate cyclase (GGDEF)-like protein